MANSRNKYIRRKFSTQAFKMKKRVARVEQIVLNVAAVLVVILFVLVVKNTFITPKKAVSVPLENVAAFRVPYRVLNDVKQLSAKYNVDFYEALTVYSVENNFFPNKAVTPSFAEIEQSFFVSYKKIKNQYSTKKLAPYYQLFENIFSEIKNFPIPEGFEYENSVGYMYGDSYGAERTYGGERTHEGTDILDRENVRGRIPIVSMTNGVVKNIGWNELGGYRVGIVTENGTYYYYAHLDSFAENLKEGSSITAGQQIGLMGDSGYDKKEGTKGKFPVHLHVGILPKTSLSKKELWVNPYPYLRYIEGKKVSLSLGLEHEIDSNFIE